MQRLKKKRATPIKLRDSTTAETKNLKENTQARPRTSARKRKKTFWEVAMRRGEEGKEEDIDWRSE